MQKCAHVFVRVWARERERERKRKGISELWYLWEKQCFINTWNRKISFKPLTNIYCTTYRGNINISPKGARLDYKIFSNMMPAAFKQQDDFDNASSVIQTHSSWMRDYNITTHCVKIWLQSSMYVWKINFILDIDPHASSNKLFGRFKHMFCFSSYALW